MTGFGLLRPARFQHHKEFDSINRIIIFISSLLFLISASTDASETITLGYALWDTEIASTHVVATVIQDELGYDVEMIALDGGPMFHALANAELDAIVAAWLPFDHAAYWDAYGADLVDYGPNLERASLGFVVPSYVAVDSIAELNDHAERFDHTITGIDPGAGLTLAAEGAIEAYELDLTLVDGSGFAMTAALERAVERGDWIVVAGWEPHWKWLVHDLKFLDDPKGAFGGVEHIHTIVSIPFDANGHEDVRHFLKEFNWSHEAMNSVMLDINHHDLDPWEAARKWVAANQETVQAWLP